MYLSILVQQSFKNMTPYLQIRDPAAAAARAAAGAVDRPQPPRLPAHQQRPPKVPRPRHRQVRGQRHHRRRRARGTRQGGLPID